MGGGFQNLCAILFSFQEILLQVKLDDGRVNLFLGKMNGHNSALLCIMCCMKHHTDRRPWEIGEKILHKVIFKVFLFHHIGTISCCCVFPPPINYQQSVC